ncbi:MAG: TolC family protein [Acidimicrobiia bacterium]|nr:TolC family protein [Acidimicrobiia bacterium]
MQPFRCRRETDVSDVWLGPVRVMVGPRLVCGLVAALLSATANVARAQNPPGGAAVPATALRVAISGGEVVAPPRPGIAGDAPLSLEEAVAQALEHNKDLAVSRLARAQAGFGVGAAQGAFDPRMAFESSFLRQVTPVGSLIGGAASGALTSQDVVAGPAVHGRVAPLGTAWDVSFLSRRQTSDNEFVTLNPQFPSTLSLNFVQPLLRGRSIDDARRRLEVARRGETLSAEQVRASVIEVVTRTEQAYWQLVFAARDLDVQIEGLDLARQQVAGTERLVEQGAAAPIDVVEARAQVAAIEQNVYGAQTRLTRAENALKALIAPDAEAGIWSRALLPVSEPRVLASGEALDGAVSRALARRPELAQLAASTAANRTDTEYFRDQTRPELNLVASYTSSGLAGQLIPPGPNPFTSGFQPILDRLNALSMAQGLGPLPTFELGGGGSSVPPRLVGGLSQSLGLLAGQDFPTARVGLRIALPLRNRTAEANLASALADGRRLAIQREQIEEAIGVEVRNTLQGVQSARATLAAAAEARRLSEEQYESEQRRFEAGTSTLFLVLQRQTAMITARSRHAQAETSLAVAIADLHAATGDVIDVHGIRLAGAGTAP